MAALCLVLPHGVSWPLAGRSHQDVTAGSHAGSSRQEVTAGSHASDPHQEGTAELGVSSRAPSHPCLPPIRVHFWEEVPVGAGGGGREVLKVRLGVALGGNGRGSMNVASDRVAEEGLPLSSEPSGLLSSCGLLGCSL